MPGQSDVSVIPHLRVTWGGNLGTPATEIWSNGVALGLPTGEIPSEPEVNAMVPLFYTHLAAWIGRPSSYISQSAHLNWVKAAWILPTGLQRDTNTAVFDVQEDIRGNYPDTCIWAQTYAITWRTDLKRGRGHSGRIYPPMVVAGPAAQSPYCPASLANDMAVSATTLLAGLLADAAQAMGPSARALFPVVVSKGKPSTGLLPKVTKITGVVVDRVADIQHRRTNRVPRLEGTKVPLYP